MAASLIMKNIIILRVRLFVFCGAQTTSLIYYGQLHLQKQENKEWRCPIILTSFISVKSISLKTEDFLCVLKTFSLWTLPHELIAFSEKKMFHLLNTKVVLCKRRESFSSFIVLKTGKTNYTKCCLNLLIWKK